MSTAIVAGLGMLAGVTAAWVAYGIGRLHERDLVATRRTEAAEDEALRRPVVDVDDAGMAWCPPSLDESPGRHYWGRTWGSSAQLAWAASNSAAWAVVRPLLVNDARLEAIDV